MGGSKNMSVKKVTKKELYNRMTDLNILKDWKASVDKYGGLDTMLGEILYSDGNFKVDDQEIKFNNKEEFQNFAAAHKGKPFFELGRQPGQHFKLYAMSKGIEPEDIVSMVENPESAKSIKTKAKLKDLRQGFISMCAKENIDEIADMYAGYTKVVKEHANQMFDNIKSIEKMTKNWGMIEALGGSYSYIAQSLEYKAPKGQPELTTKLVESVDKKLKEQGMKVGFDDLYNMVEVNEMVMQIPLGQTLTQTKKNYTVDSTASGLSNVTSTLAAIDYLTKHVKADDPQELMKVNNEDMSFNATLISALVRSDVNRKIKDLPDNLLTFYVKEGEMVAKGELKESEYDISNPASISYKKTNRDIVIGPVPEIPMKDKLLQRMIDTEPLEELAAEKAKYREIDNYFGSTLIGNHTYKINGEERKFADADAFARFAREHQGKPFMELYRHPEQHFKVYALSKGVKPEELIRMIDEPNAEESKKLKNKIENMRDDFVKMCADENLEQVSQMYADFAEVTKEYSSKILDGTKSIEAMTEKAGLCMVFGGCQSYIEQSLNIIYTRDMEPNTQSVIRMTNEKLQKKGSDVTFEDMMHLMVFNEIAFQVEPKKAIERLKKVTSAEDKVSTAFDVFSALARIDYITEHITAKEPAAVMKQITNEVLDDAASVSGVLSAENPAQGFDKIPERIRKYYLKEGEVLPEGELKTEDYKVINLDDKSVKEQLFDSRMKAPYEEARNKFAINKDDMLPTIDEGEEIPYEAYPVRKAVITPFPEEPKPFNEECPNNVGFEQKLMVDRFNSYIYESEKLKWMNNCLEQVMYEGTTFAPNPEEPEQKVTLQGMDECRTFLKRFIDKPFHELSRPGNQADHMKAFCMAEGVKADELYEMFTNPDSPNAKITRKKVEKARQNLFETACCMDEELATSKAVDFYEKYLKQMKQASEKFYTAGDFSDEAQLKYINEYSGSGSLLQQTLGISLNPPRKMGLEIVDRVNDRLKESGIDATMAEIEKLASKVEHTRQSFDTYSKYIPYDKPEAIMGMGNYDSAFHSRKLLEEEAKEFGPSFDNYMKNAGDITQYNIWKYNGDSYLDEHEIDKEPELAIKFINDSLYTKEERTEIKNNVYRQTGDLKETMKGFMEELKACDSGFLKLRGSGKFKDMRTAIDELNESIQSMSDNPSSEFYEALGEQFAEVQRLSSEYLKGKTDVDQKAQTNAGRRKNIADIFNTYSNIGKAFCQYKQDDLAARYAEHEKVHEAFTAKSEKFDFTAKPIEEQKAKVEPEKPKEVVEPEKPKAVEEAPKPMVDSAEVKAQKHAIWEKVMNEKTDVIIKIGDSDSGKLKLSKDERCTLAAKWLVNTLVENERFKNDPVQQPMLNTIVKVGYDKVIELCSNTPTIRNLPKNIILRGQRDKKDLCADLILDIKKQSAAIKQPDTAKTMQKQPVQQKHTKPEEKKAGTNLAK